MAGSCQITAPRARECAGCAGYFSGAEITFAKSAHGALLKNTQGRLQAISKKSFSSFFSGA
jgi:hypothetical protein